MKQYVNVTTIALSLAMVLSSCAPASTSTAPASTSAPTALAPTQPAAPTAVGVVPTATAAPAVAVPFTLTSTAFEANATIPEQYSCNGGGLSPALAWSAAPAGTQSFALVMEDPDAVPVAGHIWDHWVIFNIPPTTLSLPEGLTHSAELPDGTTQGLNSSNGAGYQGPCPPGGQVHGYVFTLYALDTLLDAKADTTKDALLKAIDGHILAKAVLIGKYGKQ